MEFIPWPKPWLRSRFCYPSIDTYVKILILVRYMSDQYQVPLPPDPREGVTEGWLARVRDLIVEQLMAKDPDRKAAREFAERLRAGKATLLGPEESQKQLEEICQRTDALMKKFAEILKP